MDIDKDIGYWFRVPESCANKEVILLGYSLLFLSTAMVAAVFGFGGIAGVATLLAKVLFIVFLILFVLSVVGEKDDG